MWKKPCACSKRQTDSNLYRQLAAPLGGETFSPGGGLFCWGEADSRRQLIGRPLLTRSTCLSASVTDWAMEAWYHPSIA
jgi:hypothetical protein